ncbi:DUF7551 domain-containing protein [Halopelagius longus]|uniref:Uncharacterized protein n=1 Tax=Halopelagius longus TaxID=1236180 RepID=A0A1H0YX58_9EURY|nr:hypothetical protein [Halopelagius longus]RDI72718.1 hypothetical protein DWB78_13855 [Halopelagius longus]SDQ19733.1 hypothetical protein SAMN05216278_0891 [Halopelagius longus]
MVGRSLREIRDRIDELADEDGRYGIVCGRTGERIVPVADARFEDRAAAAEAAKLAEEYRAALRRYDPRVMVHDPIVRDASASSPAGADRATPGEPTAAGAIPSELVEFCHDVAAAVFEALSVHGHRTVEDAVMDSYFDAAETVADRDELCVALLRCMARDIDDHLSPTEQARVLETAAATLSSVDASDRPVEAALARLRAKSVVDAYEVETIAAGDAEGSVRRITLDGYRLRDDRRAVPTLPLVVELLRGADGRRPSGGRGEFGDGYPSLSVSEGEGPASSRRVTVTVRSRDRPRGLSSVRVGDSA